MEELKQPKATGDLNTQLATVLTDFNKVQTSMNTLKTAINLAITEEALPPVVNLVLSGMGVNNQVSPVAAYVVLSWQSPAGVPPGTMFQSYWRQAGVQSDGITPYPWKGWDGGSPTSITYGTAPGTAVANILNPGTQYEFAISTVSDGSLGNESLWTLLALTTPAS